MKRTIQGEPGRDWTEEEVRATVSTYFRMLKLSLNSQRFVKANYTRELEEMLPARTKGAIERKYGNISAVLMELGVQPLSGYKPLANYQRLIVQVVSEYLGSDSELDRAALREVEMGAEPPLVTDLDQFVVEVPSGRASIAERRQEWIRKAPVRKDYLAREARNQSLGLAGELLALEYESRRLHALGQKKLASMVEHVSQSRGDGLGFDILSFDIDGRERFIEVKTTSYIAETPFFVSENEVQFSDANSEQYNIYRIFNFRRGPKMFMLPGSVASRCLLDPVTYRATLLAL